MAHLLGGENLHLEYPTRVVFDGVTVGLNEGDRVGIVGRNGDGKSTLLGLLSGRIEPDGGRVTVRRGTTIGVLDQRDTLDDGATVAGSIDLVVHLDILPSGARRVREIVGLPGRVEEGVVEIADLFRLEGERLVRGDGFPPHPDRFARDGHDLAALLEGPVLLDGVHALPAAQMQLMTALLADTAAVFGTGALLGSPWPLDVSMKLK